MITYGFCDDGDGKGNTWYYLCFDVSDEDDEYYIFEQLDAQTLGWA